MRLRVILSILINLVAVAAPGAVLFYEYGPAASVDPQSMRDMMFLLGTAFFAFALGLGSSLLLRSEDKPALIGLVEDLFSRDSRRART
jgi:hypothetical protein